MVAIKRVVDYAVKIRVKPDKVVQSLQSRLPHRENSLPFVLGF